MVLCFSKATPNFDNIVIVAISFDPKNAQWTQFDLPPAALGLTADSDLVAEELMRGQVAQWRTGSREILLDPGGTPFSVWRVRPVT